MPNDPIDDFFAPQAEAAPVDDIDSFFAAQAPPAEDAPVVDEVDAFFESAAPATAQAGVVDDIDAFFENAPPPPQQAATTNITQPESDGKIVNFFGGISQAIGGAISGAGRINDSIANTLSSKFGDITFSLENGFEILTPEQATERNAIQPSSIVGDSLQAVGDLIEVKTVANTTAEKVFNGGGQFLGLLAGGGSAALLKGASAGTKVTALLGIGQGAESGYDDYVAAIQKNEGIEFDDNTKNAAVLFNGLIGASEALPVLSSLKRLSPDGKVPVGKFFEFLDKNTNNAFTNALKKGVIGAGEEGLQEFTANVLQNLTAVGLEYDPERSLINKNTLEQAEVGGYVGGIINAIIGALTSNRKAGVNQKYREAQNEPFSTDNQDQPNSQTVGEERNLQTTGRPADVEGEAPGAPEIGERSTNGNELAPIGLGNDLPAARPSDQQLLGVDDGNTERTQLPDGTEQNIVEGEASAGDQRSIIEGEAIEAEGRETGQEIVPLDSPDKPATNLIETSDDANQIVVASNTLPAEIVEQANIRRTKSAKTSNNFDLNVAEESKRDAITRKFQNSFLRFNRVQDAIKAQGFNITDVQDVVGKEVLFHGKVERDLRALEEEFLQPFTKFVANNDFADAKVNKQIKEILDVDITTKKRNQAFEVLDIYLLAKHAPERNAYIATINENLPDGGSGISTQQALELQRVIEDSPAGEKYRQLADNFYRMADSRREFLKESGLVNESVIDSFQDAYQYYVPLKGFYDPKLDQNAGSGSARGFNLARELNRASGRTSLPSSPVANIISDTTTSIINSKKLEVANGLYELAVEFNDNTLWEVFTDNNPDVKSVNRGGKVVQQKQDMTDPSKYVKAFVDGEAKYIKLNDPLLDRAWQNLSSEQMGGLLSSMGVVSRFVSKTATSLNPEFIITNFSRDLPNAIFNTLTLENFDAETKKQVAKNTLRDVFPSMKAIYQGERGQKVDEATATAEEITNNNRLLSYYNEFVEDGAKTGFFDSKSITQIQKDLEGFARLASDGTVGKGLRTIKVVGDFIENVNASVENASRLSVYSSLRDQGVSRQQAAIVAKELTVNFNKKGEFGPTLNALYAFFNASVQGTARFARAIKSSKKAQGAAAGVSALGYILASIARGVSEEDEDGVEFYDKIPDFVKRKNIVIMKADGKDYWAIPLPYGLNFFYNAGSVLEGVANSSSDNNNAGNAAKNLVATAMESFVPISAGDSASAIGLVAKTITPTPLKPVIELVANEDVFGNPIAREDFNSRYPTPNSSKSNASTPVVLKDITAFLNEASGGNFYTPGAIDISPDQIDHIYQFATGGVGRFIENAAISTTRAVTDSTNEVPDNKIPFWRVISKENSPYFDIGQYYERTGQLKQMENTAKNLPKELKKVFDVTYPELQLLTLTAKRVEKKLKELKKSKDRINNSKISEERKRFLLQDILQRQKEASIVFNKRWNKVFESNSNQQ